MNRQRVLCLSALALLCAVAWAGTARAYDVPQVCVDAFELQRKHLDEDLARVVAMYTRCLDGNLSPKNRGTVFYNRGNAKHKMGDDQGAVVDYTHALKHRPQYDKAYYNRGNAKDDMGDYPGAVADYTRAIEINPEHAMAYGNRAFSYKKMGETEKARADSKKALEIDPTVKVPQL